MEKELVIDRRNKWNGLSIYQVVDMVYDFIETAEKSGEKVDLVETRETTTFLCPIVGVEEWKDFF